MSVNAVVSKGTQFKRGNGASNEIFTKLSEVNSIGLPNLSRPTIDVTDLDSTAREYVAALRTSGEVTVGMNFTRTTYIATYADYASDTARNYQIVLPDTSNTTIEFTGYVSGISGSAPGPDEKVSVEVTYTITGDITITS